LPFGVELPFDCSTTGIVAQIVGVAQVGPGDVFELGGRNGTNFTDLFEAD